MQKYYLIACSVLFCCLFSSLSTGTSTYPDKLKDWKILIIESGSLVPAQGTLPYAVAQSLFSDYARKLRTITLPKGARILWKDDGFEFPVGTILTKTFYYPTDSMGRVLASTLRTLNQRETGVPLDLMTPIETRLLVYEEIGWVPLSYSWKGGEAIRTPIGDSHELTLLESSGKHKKFTYIAPAENECNSCHIKNTSTKLFEPLGFRPLHLNRKIHTLAGEKNQLEHFEELQLLSGFNTKTMLALTDKLENQARLYLDIHCAHCHNKNGYAKHMGLSFSYSESSIDKLGICKDPVTYQNDSAYVIWPRLPEKSTLLQRLTSLELSTMMPPLGRSLVDHEGIALIQRWIKNLSVTCE